ncbi:MAG TPA: hypothetical protein V6C89_13085 [Drouetiella sp.]
MSKSNSINSDPDSFMNEDMNAFRRASRELFNNHFRPVESDGHEAWLAVERFQIVEAVLFEQLVTVPNSIEKVPYGEVQPKIEVVLRFSTDVPAFIKENAETPEWEHPTEKTLGPDALLGFVSFYDFESPNVCIDNQYVMVKILGHATKPDLVGKFALLYSFYVGYRKI